MTETSQRPPDARPLMKRVGVLLPAVLFALALLLRLVGIGWGLKNDLHNQSYHPDETLIWANSQRIEPSKLNFTPGFYNYGTLYLTVLKVASDMTAAYTGGPDPKNADATWAFVSRCHMAGRIINALAGAGTVLFVFLTLRRFIGSLGASAGALALAFAPAHVVHSRFQTVDIFAAFLLAAGMYFALRLIPVDGEELDVKSARRWVLLAGIFIGLSAGTKYTGIVGLLTLYTVLALCRRPTFLKEALSGTAAAVVAFLVATPGAVLDFEAFKRDVGFEMSHTAEGHGLVFAGTGNGYVYHLGNLFSGIGLLVVLLALVGLGWAAYRRHVWALALLAFFIPYYLLIGGATDKYMRYTFPLFFVVAAGFGYAIAVGHRRKGIGLAAVAAGILGLGGIPGGGLRESARDTMWMAGTDPRDAAARYLKGEASKKPDMVVGLASDPWYWSPPLFPDSTSMRPARLDLMALATQPRVVYYIPPDGNPHTFDEHLVTDLAPDAIAISTLETTMRDRLVGLTGLSGDAAAAAAQYKSFNDALRAKYEPDRSFGEETRDTVEDMLYIQPVVSIWKKK